jgi:hypothetical protein
MILMMVVIGGIMIVVLAVMMMITASVMTMATDEYVSNVSTSGDND